MEYCKIYNNSELLFISLDMFKVDSGNSCMFGIKYDFSDHARYKRPESYETHLLFY